MKRALRRLFICCPIGACGRCSYNDGSLFELLTLSHDMQYISDPRCFATPSAQSFSDILLGGLAPDGGLYLPSNIRKSQQPNSTRGARCRMPTWHSRC